MGLISLSGLALSLATQDGAELLPRSHPKLRQQAHLSAIDLSVLLKQRPISCDDDAPPARAWGRHVAARHVKSNASSTKTPSDPSKGAFVGPKL